MNCSCLRDCRKTAAIRRTAVRETCVHHRGQIQCLPETLPTHINYKLRKFGKFQFIYFSLLNFKCVLQYEHIFIISMRRDGASFGETGTFGWPQRLLGGTSQQSIDRAPIELLRCIKKLHQVFFYLRNLLLNVTNCTFDIIYMNLQHQLLKTIELVDLLSVPIFGIIDTWWPRQTQAGIQYGFL